MQRNVMSCNAPLSQTSLHDLGRGARALFELQLPRGAVERSRAKLAMQVHGDGAVLGFDDTWPFPMACGRNEEVAWWLFPTTSGC